jgi:uncharacterized membrane protein YhhN
MEKVFLILFAGNSIIHLGALLQGREGVRRISKILLLPLLAGYYLAGAERFLFTVVLAAFLGWLGDILLIKSDKRIFFTLGLLCFLLGHIAYILSLLYRTGGAEAGGFRPGNLNGAVLAVSAAVMLVLGFCIFRLIRPDRGMTAPVIAYEFVLGGMSLCALQFMLSAGGPWGISVFAGSLCFLLSDTLLGRFTFQTTPRYGHFFVMLPYILAQGGIIIGLARF